MAQVYRIIKLGSTGKVAGDRWQVAHSFFETRLKKQHKRN
jgi:hypothetical protein